jgi:hypothetical protein
MNGYAPFSLDPVMAAAPLSVVVAVAPLGNMNIVPVPVVFVPVRLPVQLAPLAQQAMLLASSREQFVPCLQHALALPSSLQGLKPAGQLFSARRRTRRTSKARLLAVASSAGVKGAVSVEWTVEVRNVAAIQIHREARILGVLGRGWNSRFGE